MDASSDPEFWQEICSKLLIKKNELELYEKHFGRDERSQVVIPPMKYFGIIPMEILQHIFSFLNLIDISRSVRRVCQMFATATHTKHEKIFWRTVLQNDWNQISHKSDKSEKLEEIEEVAWSISERGEFLVGKTLWMQHKGKNDTEWGIVKTPEGMQEGRMENGGLVGRGKETSDNGNEFEGEWKDDKREGKGLYRWKAADRFHGDVYYGDWKNDNIEGIGTYKFNDGSLYEGEWKNSRREGHGTMIYINGSVYVGQFKKGAADGEGTLKFEDGGVYTGSWKGHKRHGKGKMINANGDVYEGGFKSDMMHGKGKMTDKAGVYVGRWRCSVRVGKGQMTDADVNDKGKQQEVEEDLPPEQDDLPEGEL